MDTKNIHTIYTVLYIFYIQSAMYTQKYIYIYIHNVYMCIQKRRQLAIHTFFVFFIRGSFVFLCTYKKKSGSQSLAGLLAFIFIYPREYLYHLRIFISCLCKIFLCILIYILCIYILYTFYMHINFFCIKIFFF